MEKLNIAGGYPLKGTVRISGAKNSAVALIPATILADSPVTIEGLPDISDVEILKDCLKKLAVKSSFHDEDMTVDPSVDDFNAFAKWKSKNATCLLLFNGCDAWAL